MKYTDALEWLYSIQHFGIKLGLDGSKELLRKFLAYPSYGTKVIHVAGTNGKGSVCAMMEMLIRGAGHRTAIFTSPHLVHFRERIKVNSLMISEEECASYLTKLRAIAEGMQDHPTFFEITLALAMRYFKDQGAEYVILETGMGGRLDATTAVPSDISVIMPISMDHSEWLGDSIEKIALEKAGIMKEGVPVIISKQVDEANMILHEEANMRRCPLTVVDTPLVGYSVGILGEHQRYNAHVAVQTVHEVGVYLNYDTVKECLQHVYWPGRFELIEGWEQPIILDGAHNIQAVEALVKTWGDEFKEIKPVVVFGAVEEKDVKGVLAQLKNIAEHFIFTPLDSPRSMKTDSLVKAMGDATSCEETAGLDAAWDQAVAFGRPILITGSLFLIGEVKAKLEKANFERSAQ